MKSLAASFASTLAIAAALSSVQLAHAEVINVYTSANFAPLILADGRGIYPDLIAHLNRHKPGGLTFKLNYLPRKRLQLKLEDGSLDGLVIGMMPEWLGDTGQKKYLWTSAFASERFVLVSRSARPIAPDHPDSLVGASVGTTQGFVYPGIDAWLNKARAQRSDGVSDEKNLEKLLLDRLDSVMATESMARYYIKSHNLQDALHIAAMPGAPLERRFVAPRSEARAFTKVAPVIRKLRDDPGWQRTAAHYQ